MGSEHGSENTYVADASNGAEMARLIDQDNMITREIGLFPAELDLLEVRCLLDVACGPGGWAREVARHIPDVEVVGIDINREMIDYATAFAQVGRLSTVQFQVMDVTRPLAFADATFDLVNARLLFAFVSRQLWPALVKECARVTRPGGYVVLAETGKLCNTNSKAVETFLNVLIEAMLRAGYYAGISSGVTPHLTTFLREAGLTEIQTTPYRIDCPSGTAACAAMVSNLKIAMQVGQPFLIKMGYFIQEEMDRLYEQGMCDMNSSDFHGHIDITRVWGKKLADLT